MGDVDEIKALPIVVEPEKDAMTVVKLRPQTCIIPPPASTTVAAEIFHKLSWQRLTICLICEAVALGCLSMPASFATLGMAWGLVATFAIGFLSIYTSLQIGEIKCRNPHLRDYVEIGRLLFGQAGWYTVATMFVMLLVLTTGSHVLTGIIAFQSLFDHKLCSVIFGLISALVLFLLALPKTFHQMAILAYLDFASILAAVIITIVVSAVESRAKPGGLHATSWHFFLPANERPDFVKVMLALTNIVLAFAFQQCLPSFMSELKRPQDYKKSLWTVGLLEIVFYTIVGASIYFLKGKEVMSPALLNISPKMQKVVFGVAMPVIFISGSINGQTAARFLYDLIYLNSPKHKYINTTQGILSWIALGLLVTTIAWVAAEVIPSFSTFLGLMASLFVACFSWMLPSCMYFMLLRKRKMDTPKQPRWFRLSEDGLNILNFGIGLLLLFVGSAACIISLIREYKAGISTPFAC